MQDLSAWRPDLLVTLSHSYENGKRIRRLQERVDRCTGMQRLHLYMNFLSSKANLTLSDADKESLRKVDPILRRLHSGDRVVVHCHAGLHRTGFFIYVLLRRNGLTLHESLEALRTTRRRTFTEMTYKKGCRVTLVDKAEVVFNELFHAF